MGNTQQRMTFSSSANTPKIKTSMSMQTTPKQKSSHLTQSATTNNIQDKQQCSTSQISNQRNKNGKCVDVASKCFPSNKLTSTTTTTIQQEQQPQATFGHRLLHRWRKSILKTSQTHLNHFNTATEDPLTGGVSAISSSSFANRPNRSSTDQNLFIIEDNFVEFVENEINDTDMVDLNIDENPENQLTIDSKLLRDVNQKLKSIRNNYDDDSDTENEHLDTNANVDLTNVKKLTKSPAIFNISQYTNTPENNNNNKDTVKDFFNEQPIVSSDSYDDSFSESSAGENFEEYEKRHGGGGVRKISQPISISSTSSSVSSVSSISSFTSSNLSLNVQRPITSASQPPPLPPPISTKNTNRLRNLLPKFKLKLTKSNSQPKKLKDNYDTLEIEPLANTDAQLYSFKERFEIKEGPSGGDLESLCFIDETSSYSLSSSSSILVSQMKNNQNQLSHAPLEPAPSTQQQHQSTALKFLNQVNKRLNFYRLKKQAKEIHELNKMDSVSNRVSLNEDKENVAIYDDRTIEKIINRENNFLDYNDNNDELDGSNGDEVMNIDDEDVDDSEVKLKFNKPNMNEVNSIARLKINAPLASSEHTTPLSRSIDFLNRLDQFKIKQNNTNNSNNNNSIRNQNSSSNVAATLPIKKYYRLSANTSIYNSPNR